jgi:death-on-curing protein
MSEPVWVRRETLELLHSESIAEHGGLDGLRDEGLLESALARPRNLFRHEGTADVVVLAAAYVFALTKAAAFVDGNKRIALIAAGAFLHLNGWRIATEQAQLAFLMFASDASNETAIAVWLRERCVRISPREISIQKMLAKSIAHKRRTALSLLAKQ